MRQVNATGHPTNMVYDPHGTKIMSAEDVRVMSQRDKMRELYRLHAGDEAKCVTGYAAAERQGLVHRVHNASDLDEEAYALALFLDGTRKGWIRE